MDTKLKTYLLYAIADALGMTIELDHKTQKLSGATSRDVMFGNLPVSFDIKIVSGALLADQYMVICKVMGNLSLFVVAYKDGKQDRLDLHFLNQAKADSFHGLLEKMKPTSKEAVVKRLGPALVKSFVKKTRNTWEQAA